MKFMFPALRHVLVGAVLFLVGAMLNAASFHFTTASQAAEPIFPKPEFNDKGELLRPDTRYREWVYVGTPLTPNDLNNGKASFPDFHNVYIHPDDFAHWK